MGQQSSAVSSMESGCGSVKQCLSESSSPADPSSHATDVWATFSTLKRSERMSRFNAQGTIGSIEVSEPTHVSEIIFATGERAYCEADTLQQLTKLYGSLEGSLGQSIVFGLDKFGFVKGFRPTDTAAFDRRLRSFGDF